jgi:hypothetical protein
MADNLATFMCLLSINSWSFNLSLRANPGLHRDCFTFLLLPESTFEDKDKGKVVPIHAMKA